MDEATLESSLQEFLKDVLRLRIAPVERDAELVADGHVDSMDLVRIAAHLEELLDIEIPDDDVNDENFGSLARTLQYCERARS